MYKSTDEKFKDSSPAETIANIEAILKRNGLTLQEEQFEQTVCNCHCVRFFLNGTSLFTTGKGITKELASASGHGELIERLQAGKLGYGAIKYNDAVMMDRATLAASSGQYFSRIAEVAAKFDAPLVTADRLIDACFEYEGDSDLTEAVPFYSATDDKTVYLPSRLMHPLFTSTGNCAGNSAEEAIVQGVSEIIERWNQRHFMCTDLVPPTIPDDYLKSFPIPHETITEIKNAGYEVIVKDCSMGTGYPVIATAVIDKKKHAYHVHFGSSPVFEIALNRSLTETFQGRILSSVADTLLSESSKNNALTFRKSYHLGRGAYPLAFFTDNSSFEFIPFPDRTACTNSQLLDYAYQYIKAQNMMFYIRDLSHLGFHAYKIIIPDMCKAPFDIFQPDLPIPLLEGATEKIQRNLKQANEEQLLNLQLLNCYKINNLLLDNDPKCSALMRLPVARNARLDRAIGYIHLGYVEWAFGNKSAALNYAKNIQNQAIPEISDYFSCLIRVFSMQKTTDNLSDILQQLTLFYSESTVNEVQQVLSCGKNPFENYIVSCSPEAGSCAACRYSDTCEVLKRMAITDMLNKRTAAFDNEKAFTKLRDLFQKIS